MTLGDSFFIFYFAEFGRLSSFLFLVGISLKLNSKEQLRIESVYMQTAHWHQPLTHKLIP